MNKVVSMEERRSARRIPATDLYARLQMKRGLRKEWVDITPLDFSVDGVAIETDKLLQQGDALTLSIEIRTDVGDIVIDKLAGQVRYVIEKSPYYRYGVSFDFETQRFMRSVELRKRLERMESLLLRQKRVASKIEAQQQRVG